MDPLSPPGRPAEASVLTDYAPPEPTPDRLWVHAALFVATFASTVLCGGLLVGRSLLWPTAPQSFFEAVALLATPTYLADGLAYAVPFLLFLTVHEFGHYIAARVRDTRVSLPYFLPVPILGAFGTFGAVIRIKEPLRRTRQLFDIGAAGPLAGFVVAVGVLVVAALTQPPPEYLLGVAGHADVVETIRQTGAFPVFDASEVPAGVTAYVFGDTPLFHLIGSLAPLRVSADEIIHYPMLLAGWLALFFTALNLLPVGQLDGGHVVYALFGPAVHRVVARVTTLLLLLSGGVGTVMDLGSAPGLALEPWLAWLVLVVAYAVALGFLFARDWRLVAASLVTMTGLTALLVLGLPGLAAAVGWSGWLFWVGMILFVIRVDHPPVLFEEPLTPGRKALGYLCLAIFVLCFSIQPIQMLGG